MGMGAKNLPSGDSPFPGIRGPIQKKRTAPAPGFGRLLSETTKHKKQLTESKSFGMISA
jgi:hypothetical protein